MGKKHISGIITKLNRANAILSKLRRYRQKTLKSIYHTIFEPHLSYSLLFWAQNSNSIKDFVVQKKSLRIKYFRNHNPDRIALENYLS